MARPITDTMRLTDALFWFIENRDGMPAEEQTENFFRLRERVRTGESMRLVLQQTYLDWRNNYLTVAKFAEHHGLTEDQAGALITLAREVYNSVHPEA